MARSMIAVALAVGLFLAGCERADRENFASVDASGPMLIDQIAESASAGWVAALREHNPGEYQRIGTKLEAPARGGGNLTAARIAAMQEIAPFMSERKRSLKAASDAELVEYMKRNVAVLEHLAEENPAACVEVVQGRLNPSVELSDTAWSLMSSATAQLLAAAKAAEERPVARSSSSISAEEQHNWIVEMGNAGATRRTAELLRDRNAAASATPYELCQVRVVLLKGALLTEPSVAARIMLSAG